MDDIVVQAMAKWPNVPDCFGWLGLDARGRWYLRDESVQAAGSFARSKGSELRHAKLMAFIARNYGCDTQGRWYFQNGPQRVYVELEFAPWVWRIQPGLWLESHTGRRASAAECLVDAGGRVYLATSLGLGLVHSLDVGLAADAIAQGVWRVQEVAAESLPTRYGFALSPEQAARA